MKLFTNSYLNDYKILKNSIIGFEIEFFSKINYPMTLEVLNRELAPMNIKVWGNKNYHPDFKVDANNFLLTPDVSGGFQMAELITGPIEYTNIRLILLKCLSIIQKIGYTTDRSGLHVNISFKDKEVDKINILKLILNLEEKKIYDLFPDRKENVYAKSIKTIIPYKDYDYTNSTANILGNSLLLPNTKYYGINFSTLKDGRLEFRYIGGEDYQFKINSILELVDYFTVLSYNSINTVLDENESRLLRSYLDENIRKYKALSKLDSFMSEFPSVELQIDKRNDYEIVNPYYSLLYDDIYDVITLSKNLKNVIINYDTETKAIELVGGQDIEFIGVITQIDFIDCTLTGEFLNCNFIDSKLDNSIITSCSLYDTDAKDSKLLMCKIDRNSILDECYFTEGTMDGTMNSGVFRSGKIGENGIISPETKVLNDEQNFFNIKSDDFVNKKSLKKDK